MSEVIDSVTITQVQEGQAVVQEMVQSELDRQLRKWGTQSHQPVYWIGILGEEFGEACKEAIEWGLHKPEVVSRALLFAELTHVAAVAIAAAECLQRTIAEVAPDDDEDDGPMDDDAYEAYLQQVEDEAAGILP